MNPDPKQQQKLTDSDAERIRSESLIKFPVLQKKFFFTKFLLDTGPFVNNESHFRNIFASKYIRSSSVADPGCFIPDPDPNIFHYGFRIPKVFIPDPGSYCTKKRDEK
jgi:hypothetical protein